MGKYVFGFSLIFLFACERTVDLNFKLAHEYVVYCELSNSFSPVLHLRKIVQADNHLNTVPVLEAKIEISDSQETFTGIMQGGIYRFPALQPKPGIVYTLSVEHPDISFKATASMPDTIDRLIVKPSYQNKSAVELTLTIALKPGDDSTVLYRTTSSRFEADARSWHSAELMKTPTQLIQDYNCLIPPIPTEIGKSQTLDYRKYNTKIYDLLRKNHENGRNAQEPLDPFYIPHNIQGNIDHPEVAGLFFGHTSIESEPFQFQDLSDSLFNVELIMADGQPIDTNLYEITSLCIQLGAQRPYCMNQANNQGSEFKLTYNQLLYACNSCVRQDMVLCDGIVKVYFRVRNKSTNMFSFSETAHFPIPSKLEEVKVMLEQ